MSARIAGIDTPLVAMVAASFALVLIALMHTPDEPQPAPAPYPAPGSGTAYAPYVFADGDTGCQYLSTHMSAGLAPRIAADGRTHMGCKGGANGKS